MARQVLPIVGAVIGAYYGNPQLGYAIGSIIGNAVDPEVIQGPKIGDVAAQTSAEGVFQPIFFGTCSSFGNMIDQGPDIIRKEEESGKGGGPVTETERLYKSFAIRLGVGWNGPIAAVTRIWEDGKLVYDVRPESQIPQETAEFAQGIRIYLGTEDQLPDPELEAIHGIGNAPAYPGRAYVVFIKKDITSRKSISDYRFEVATNAQVMRISALLSMSEAPGTYTSIPSPDGFDWSASPWPYLGYPAGAQLIIASQGRYVGSTNNLADDHPYYSDDNGQTWMPSSGAVATFRGQMAESNGLILIPCDGGIMRSTDGGLSFSKITSVGSTTAICEIEANLCVTVGADLTIRYSSDYGVTWNSGDPIGLSTASGYASASINGLIRYCGSVGGSDLTAKMMQTDNGIDLYEVGLPSSLTSEMQALDAGILSGNAVWIGGTQDGDIVRDVGEGFEDCSFPGSGGIIQIEFMGNGFLIISSGTSTYQSELWFTEDGSSFTNLSPTTSGQFFSAAANYSVDVAQGEPIQLDDAVVAIHGYVNQESSKVDVSELSGIELDGLFLAGDYSAASAIGTLGQTFLFDSPQYDGKIHHILRGKPVVASFGIDDLVDIPDESMREQAIEFPKRMLLEFQNPYIEYAPAVAPSNRESSDIRVVGVSNVQTPVTMDADKAYKLASILHKISWEEAKGDVVFSVSDQHTYLTSGDCVGLTLRGITRRLRITKLEYYDGQIKLTCRNDRQSAYTSNVTGINPPAPTPPPPSIVGPTMLEILDIPALLDTHDQSAPIIYIGAGPSNEVWPGALVQRSTDGGASYPTNEAVFSLNTVMGTLLNDVPAASEFYPDMTNTLTVQLDDENDQLDSLTNAQWLSEGGGLAIEIVGGGWEIMQYRDADEQSDGSYFLSTLQRGRLSTEATTHTAGQRVVFLSRTKFAAMQSSSIGQDVYHRAITNGLSPELATVENQVYTAKSQTEFPCASLTGEIAADTLSLETVPRHRFGTEDAPIRSINWTGYRWTATDGSNSSTIDTTVETASFDVTGWSTPITATVAQINRITGAGPAISEDFE